MTKLMNSPRERRVREMNPFCFQCNEEMKCLKTGFIYFDGYERFTTDLFYCSCGALATNSIVGPLDTDDPRKPQYSEGKFSPEFFKHVQEWYPQFEEVFFKFYN